MEKATAVNTCLGVLKGRDCIGVTVDYILKWFGIPIDMEEAIRERDW